jgi:hypothetical protein
MSEAPIYPGFFLMMPSASVWSKVLAGLQADWLVKSASYARELRKLSNTRVSSGSVLPTGEEL